MNKRQCKEIYDNYFIELYLSEELEENKVIEFENHIKECDRCKNLLNDEKVIIDSINLDEKLVIPPIELDEKILETISNESKKKNIFSLITTNPYFSGIAVAASILILIMFSISNNSDIEQIINPNNNTNNYYSNIEDIDLDLELENYFSLENDNTLYSYEEIDSLNELENSQNIAYGLIDETNESDEIDYYNYDDLNYYSDNSSENTISTEENSELELELENMYDYLGV